MPAFGAISEFPISAPPPSGPTTTSIIVVSGTQGHTADQLQLSPGSAGSGSYLLQETGFKIKLEDGSGFILLEGGGNQSIVIVDATQGHVVTAPAVTNLGRPRATDFESDVVLNVRGSARITDLLGDVIINIQGSARTTDFLFEVVRTARDAIPIVGGTQGHIALPMRLIPTATVTMVNAVQGHEALAFRAEFLSVGTTPPDQTTVVQVAVSAPRVVIVADDGRNIGADDKLRGIIVYYDDRFLRVANENRTLTVFADPRTAQARPAAA